MRTLVRQTAMPIRLITDAELDRVAGAEKPIITQNPGGGSTASCASGAAICGSNTLQGLQLTEGPDDIIQFGGVYITCD